MRIATVPTKKRKQLTIIGILLLGIPLVVFASSQVTQWFTRASVEPEPKNVLFTNVGAQEFTVSWVTETSATGSVIPILNNQDGTPLVDSRGSRRRRTHHVTMRALEPNTNYNFTILSDEDRYGSEGKETFTFRTPTVASTAPTPSPISGSVNGINNEDGIVFVSTKDKDVYPVSSVVSKGDTWNVDLSSLRKISDGSYVVVRDSDELIIVAVAGLSRGGFVEGTYGELFDSNGVLKEVHALNVGDMDDPYSNLDSTTISQSRVDVPLIPTLDDFDDIDDIDDMDIPDFDRPFSPTVEKRFRIIQHIEWIDMTTVEGLTTKGQMREESVEVVNITDTGFTVIWVSRQKEEGYIKYGTSRESLTNEASDERDSITTRRDYYIHFVPVTRLQPELDYYFEIYSGGEVYDNGGQKYIVSTFPRLTSPPPFESVAGVLEGLPDHNEAIVTVYIEDGDQVGSPGRSNKMASLADERGRWILSIADSRRDDGLSYFEYTSEDLANFNIITTIPTETHVEQIQGIGSRDVEIMLGGTSVLGTDDVEIGLLSNYGILGYSSGVHLPPDDVDPIDQDYEISSQTGTQIPKTGIFDNFLYIVILSLVLIVVPTSLYVIHVTKKRRRGTMIKNI
jgi:hypothetical protein